MEEVNHKVDIRRRFLAAMRHILSKRQQGCKTVADFAKRVGEYPQNISKMESGDRFPTLDHIGSICSEFGISPNWLVLNKGEMYIESELYDIVNDIERRLHRVELALKIPKDIYSPD